MFTNESASYHYRIVKHQSELLYPDEQIRDRNDFPFSIMILDSDFRVIDEVEFPGKIFDYRQSFAYQNRLYINLNNPLNKTVNEDRLMFAVYELKEHDR